MTFPVRISLEPNSTEWDVPLTVQFPNLEVSDPKHLEHFTANRIRRLTIDVCGVPGVLVPSLPSLDALTLSICSTHNFAGIRPLIDLRRLARLSTIWIQGDTPYTFSRLFKGHSTTIVECKLDGGFCIDSATDPFFERIRFCLQRLICRRVRFMAQIGVSLDQVTYLALHSTYFIAGLPCLKCPLLQALSLQGRTYGSPELNTMMERYLSAYAPQIMVLALHCGGNEILSDSSVLALTRCWNLKRLLLNGRIALDGRDWIAVASTLSLDMVVRVYDDSRRVSNCAIVHRQSLSRRRFWTNVLCRHT